MKALLLAALAIFGISLSPVVQAADAIFPPGSRIGLTPPKDMALSKRFSGFENPGKAASITLVEMPAEAYAELNQGLTKDLLKNQGMVVTSREEVTIGGKKGILIAGNQVGPVKLRKWILALNDPSVTAFVVAQALDNEKQGYGEPEIRNALKTVALRAPLSIDDQMASLGFRVPELAGFRPIRVVSGNSLVMTEGSKDIIKAAEQPILILASSMLPVPAQPEMREQLARSALSSNQTLKDLAIERSQAFRQNGADWHEIVARAKDAASGTDVVVMQTIRFSPGGYLRMIGLTRADMREAILPRFRKVVDGVQVAE